MAFLFVQKQYKQSDVKSNLISQDSKCQSAKEKLNKAYRFFCSKTYFSAKKKVVAATFAKYYFDILKTLSVKTVHFTVGSTVFTQHSIKTVFVVFYVFLLMCPNTIKAKKKWIEGVLFPTICSCIKTVTK